VTLNDVFTSPFCFLDIACGDASTMNAALRGTQVRHYRRDFVEAMMRRPQHADAAWCSLSIHHLLTEDKLRLMQAIRGATGGRRDLPSLRADASGRRGSRRFPIVSVIVLLGSYSIQFRWLPIEARGHFQVPREICAHNKSQSGNQPFGFGVVAQCIGCRHPMECAQAERAATVSKKGLSTNCYAGRRRPPSTKQNHLRNSIISNLNGCRGVRVTTWKRNSLPCNQSRV
jgi:hypothetical protein